MYVSIMYILLKILNQIPENDKQLINRNNEIKLNIFFNVIFLAVYEHLFIYYFEKLDYLLFISRKEENVYLKVNFSRIRELCVIVKEYFPYQNIMCKNI